MSTTHTNTTAGESQNARILARLQAIPGAWVSMPELSHVSGSFNIHSRAADLRKAGFRIDQKSERFGRRVESFYRIVSDDVVQIAEPWKKEEP